LKTDLLVISDPVRRVRAGEVVGEALRLHTAQMTRWLSDPW